MPRASKQVVSAVVAILAALVVVWQLGTGGSSSTPSTPTPAPPSTPTRDRPKQAPPHVEKQQPPAAPTTPTSTSTTFDTRGLPTEALGVIAKIQAGGPFRYRQDGATFQNRERRLPQRERGYYREYTVETPGSKDRGARRIVTGGDPPTEFFYTDDHYRSFRKLEPRR